MASEILIAYPHIPAAAIVIDQDFPASHLAPIHNTIRSHRRHLHVLAEANDASGSIATYTLADGLQLPAEYLIIAHNDLLQQGDVSRIRLQSSTDGSSWTTVHDINPVTEAVDYIATFTTTSARRYWRLYCDFSDESVAAFSKAYFGQFFDIGTSPSDYSSNVERVTLPFNLPSGSQWISRAQAAKRSFNLTWEGVSDEKADSFMFYIARNRYQDYFFLYAPNQYHLLGFDSGPALVHVKLTAVNREIARGIGNWNIISTAWEEVIG